VSTLLVGAAATGRRTLSLARLKTGGATEYFLPSIDAGTVPRHRRRPESPSSVLLPTVFCGTRWFDIPTIASLDNSESGEKPADRKQFADRIRSHCPERARRYIGVSVVILAWPV